jgi:hypothetical protein
MSTYPVNRKNGNLLVNVSPGNVNNTASPINLVGQGVVNYGEFIAENFVWLTENFASDSLPANSLLGQLWYNTNANTLNVVVDEATQDTVEIVTTSGAAPGGTSSPGSFPVGSEGDLRWFPGLKQLYGADEANNKWVLIGPETPIGAGTGTSVIQIGSDWVILEISNENVIGAWSSSRILFSTLNTIPFNNFEVNLGADTFNVNLAAAFSNGMYPGFTFADPYSIRPLTSPSGTTADRPSSPQQGMLRYNTTIASFEGYDGSVWRGLGGVVDADGDTYVEAESSPGADNDVLDFYAGGNQRLEIGASSSTFYGDWNLGSGASLEATYADIAERYHAGTALEAGTVVRLGGTNEIEPTTQNFDTEVFGVVSENPAFRLNSDAGDDNTHPYIALTGRVRVKVMGKVKKGQRLVSSSESGIAEAIDLKQALLNGDLLAYAASFGRAIEDKDSEGEGTVEAVVGIK